MMRSDTARNAGTLAPLSCLILALACGCTAPPHHPPDPAKISSSLAGLKLPFIANQGQEDARVRYTARTFGGTVVVTDTGQLRYSLPKAGAPQGGVVLYEEFIGGATKHIAGENRATAVVNSFHGNDRTKWRTSIPTYDSVSLGEVYPGIAVKLQAHGYTVEKLFHVQPGADPGNVRLRFSGSDGLAVTHEGELEVATELGPVRFSRPVAYQMVDGRRHEVEIEYALDADTYGFRLGEYDRTEVVVIDPVLAATFMGGKAADQVVDVAVNAAGEIYLGGTTSYPLAFPGPTIFPGINAASLDSTWMSIPPADSGEAFVVKLNAQLDTILAATFMGGSATDFGYAMSLDAAGNVYIAGVTESADLPGVSAASADSSLSGARDGFVVKLNAGLSAILGATLLGGSTNEIVRAITVDSAGNVYAAGQTDSNDFPGVNAASADSLHTGDEGFVSRLNAGLTSIVASTYVGGSGDDLIEEMTINGAGNVYVVGNTQSTDLPGVTILSADPSAVLDEVFVVRLNSALTSITAATYLGGSGEDISEAVVLDNSGNVLVAGKTQSVNFPGVNSASADTLVDDEGDAFVAKLNPGLSVIQAATFLGGSRADGAWALVRDGTAGFYVSGYTGSLDLPGISAKSAQPDPTVISPTPQDFRTGFVARLNANLTSIPAATFLGDGGPNTIVPYSGVFVGALAVTGAGSVYAAGRTSTNEFPMIGPASADPIFTPMDDFGLDGFAAKLGPCPLVTPYTGGPLDSCSISDQSGDLPLFNPQWVNCTMVDCCPLCPGMHVLDWEIYANPGATKRIVLRFEGLDPAAARRIGIEGQAYWNSAGRLVMNAGSRVTLRGLPQPSRNADAFRMTVETIYFDGRLSAQANITVKEMVNRAVVTQKTLAWVAH